MGLNSETGDLEWIIDNPAYPTLNDEINSTVIDPEYFKYTNGEHAIFLTQNSEYDNYRGK